MVNDDCCLLLHQGCMSHRVLECMRMCHVAWLCVLPERTFLFDSCCDFSMSSRVFVPHHIIKHEPPR